MSVFNISPEAFVNDPILSITPLEHRTGVLARVFAFPFGGTVRVEAINPFVREVFYDGISMGVFELSPAVEGFYEADH